MKNDNSQPPAAGEAAQLKANDVAISLYTEGNTRGYQLCIEDSCGGYRLAGPKFIGNSELLQRRVLNERDAENIRLYLQKRFPLPDYDADQRKIKALTEALANLNATYNAPGSGTYGPEQPLWDAATAALALAKEGQ